MAIITAYAGFGNMARDLTVSIVGVDGNSLANINTFQILSLDYRQVTLDITKTLANANTILADLPRYWEGTIEFVRDNANLDTYFYNLEAAWLTGNNDVDFTLGNITVTISTTKETTTMTFFDASLKFEDTSWKAEDLTTQRIAFRAGRRFVA